MEYVIVIWPRKCGPPSFIYNDFVEDYFIDLTLDPREIINIIGTFFHDIAPIYHLHYLLVKGFSLDSSLFIGDWYLNFHSLKE